MIFTCGARDSPYAMRIMITEILVILALIVLNGVLAMSELAIVSARPARLKPLEAKSRGARHGPAAGRTSGAVPVDRADRHHGGGRAVGGAVGCDAGRFGWQAGWSRKGVPADWAATLGVGGVVVAITYVSLIVGELVPKQTGAAQPRGGGDPHGPGDDVAVRDRRAAGLVPGPVGPGAAVASGPARRQREPGDRGRGPRPSGRSA